MANDCTDRIAPSSEELVDGYNHCLRLPITGDFIAQQYL